MTKMWLKLTSIFIQKTETKSTMAAKNNTGPENSWETVNSLPSDSALYAKTTCHNAVTSAGLFSAITHGHKDTTLSYCFHFFSLSVSPTFSLPSRLEGLSPCYSRWLICVLFLNIHIKLSECFMLTCFDCVKCYVRTLDIFSGLLILSFGFSRSQTGLQYIADNKRTQRAHTSESLYNDKC